MNKKVPVKFDRQHSYDSAMSNALSSGSTIFFTTKNPGSEENHAIVIGGEEYGREIPRRYHCLPYTEDVNSGKTIVQRPLLYDGSNGVNKIYVTQNGEEFSACTDDTPYVPDIVNDWIQYSDSMYMSEYSKGTKPISSNYGYNDWTGSTDSVNHTYKIANKTNSEELNGYINPEKTSVIEVESIIGTDVGSTTGDQLGVTLINTDNITPKYVEDTAGTKYYRNTLYDTTISGQECAWVNEINSEAYIVYANKNTSGNETAPSGNIWKTSDIKTKAARTTTIDTGEAFVINGGIHDANGDIYLFYVLCNNASKVGSTQCWYWDNKLQPGQDSGATLMIYGQKVTITNGSQSSRSTFTPLIDCNPTNGIGTLLIPYVSSRNGTTGPWSFIKNKTEFNNGVLTLHFSDVMYDSAITASAAIEAYGDQLLDGSTFTNEGYNLSSVIIDFNSKTYSVKDRTGVDIPGYTNRLFPSDYTSSLLSAFSTDCQFMYHAFSYSHSYIKTKGIKSSTDRLILRVDTNTVLKYDAVSKGYVPTVGEPLDYFYGSHMAYNDITKKLWYSNGTNIYELKTSQDIPSALTDTVSAITDSASTKLTQEQAVYNYLKPHTHESSAITDSVSTITDPTSTKLVQECAVSAYLGNYLPLSGGTMTGSILSNTTAYTVGTNSKPFGGMYANGFYQTSDMNKKNILGELPLDKAYDMVYKCNTILYTLKGDETNKQQIGLIAQEVEQFFPEIVSTGEDGSKSLDYARITVVLLGVLRDIVDRLNSIESK